MRVTFAVTMVLFLAPAVYVAKYYAVDKPAEEAYVQRLKACECIPSKTANALLYWEQQAKGAEGGKQRDAIRAVGGIVRIPGLNLRRPLECLGAKALLSEIAVHARDPAARLVASEELGKVAQSGAVIRR